MPQANGVSADLSGVNSIVTATAAAVPADVTDANTTAAAHALSLVRVDPSPHRCSSTAMPPLRIAWHCQNRVTADPTRLHAVDVLPLFFKSETGDVGDPLSV